MKLFVVFYISFIAVEYEYIAYKADRKCNINTINEPRSIGRRKHNQKPVKKANICRSLKQFRSIIEIINYYFQENILVLDSLFFT